MKATAERPVIDIIATRIPLLEIVLRLALAMALVFPIGWEREAREKPAGLRTHMLVSVGAAGFLIVAMELVLGPLQHSAGVRIDPTRVVEGVIGGIGFLGAGSIIRAQGDVHGLTTGASIWIAGAIGLSCGGGYYVVAVLVAAMALFILTGVRFVERFLRRPRK